MKTSTTKILQELSDGFKKRRNCCAILQKGNKNRGAIIRLKAKEATYNYCAELVDNEIKLNGE